MPSSFFSRPASTHDIPLPSSKIDTSTKSRSTLKSFSAFLSNGFASQASTSPTKQHPAVTDTQLPTEISLKDLAVLSGIPNSPFRVYINESSNIPLTQISPGLNGLTTSNTASSIPGLPNSHYSHPLQIPSSSLAFQKAVPQSQREAGLPSLASAIHIANGPTSSSTFGPTQAGLPSSISNASSINENARPVPQITSKGSIRRTMSRRLSFDNIRPLFTGNKKKDRLPSEEPLLDNHWSMVEADSTSNPSPLPLMEVPKNQNNMALPSIRTLRSKFAVGGQTRAVAPKADLISEGKKNDEEDKRGKTGRSLPPKAGDRRGFQGGSLGRAMGRSLKRIDNAADESNARREISGENQAGENRSVRPVSVTPIPPIAPPPSCPPPLPPKNAPSSPIMRTIAPRRSSLMQEPASCSPEVKEKPPIHTPAHLLSPGLQPATTQLFSPAQDDASFVDPQRSPLPTFGSMTISSSNSAQSLAHPATSVPFPASCQIATRQQSLSELKDAFTRMRTLSGLDSAPTDSQENSRRGSESQDGDREEDMEAEENRRRARRQKSLDLAGLDQSLQAVIDQNSRSTDMEPETSQGTIRPEQNHSIKDLSQSTSSSSDMVTCETSIKTDARHSSSQTQSRNSWITAKEDISILSRSKSKSNIDLSSYTTSKNLLEQIEKQQGEGWWSSEKPRPRRSSDITAPSSPKRRSTTLPDDGDRLALLERLAKSSTLPNRSRFSDAPSSPTANSSYASSPQGTPTRRRLQASTTRPSSVIDSISRSSKASLSTRYRQSVDGGRSTLPRQSISHGARPSLVAGSTWSQQDDKAEMLDSPRQHIFAPQNSEVRKRISAYTLQAQEDTPSRLSHIRGPFVDRVSPALVERVSWLSKKQVDNDASSYTSSSPTASRRTTGTVNTVATSLMASEDEEVSASKEIASLKKKHQLQLDALLSSLSASRDENSELKEEVSTLRKLLGESGEDRKRLRGIIRDLENRYNGETTPGQSRRRRSDSVNSNLLPVKYGADYSMITEAEPPTPCHLDYPEVDEFGRRIPSPSLQANTIRGRQVSARSNRSTSTFHSNILDSSAGEDEMEDNWELRLRAADEAHLSDL